jgi:hypothetical protein
LTSYRKRKLSLSYSGSDDEENKSKSSSECSSRYFRGKKDKKLKSLVKKLARGNIKKPEKFLRKLEKVLGKSSFLALKKLMIQEAHQNLNKTVFIKINDNIRMLRGSWHQGDKNVFHMKFAGRQCCAMAVTSILKAKILSPSKWSTNTINQNMMEANALYKTVHILSEYEDVRIPTTGYLFLNNFDVVKNDITMFDTSFKIAYERDPSIYGNLCDNQLSQSFGFNLLRGLIELFIEHSAGVLITQDRSYAVIASSEKFYFCDSHSCNEMGLPTDGDGQSCVIECDTIEDLCYICKRATGCCNSEYTLDYVDVSVVNNLQKCV